LLWSAEGEELDPPQTASRRVAITSAHNDGEKFHVVRTIVTFG